MIRAEDLLKPISEENPCGEDLYYDPGFQELDTLIQGKPETQFSPAEDPDWKAVRERCLELFARSKDLRIATKLCLAAMRLEGLPALREGLALIKGLVEQYWEPVFPRLDPEDGNDPLYRMNILAAIATAKGTFGDPLRFLERLQEIPLTNSRQMGRLSLADIAKRKSPVPAPDGEGAPEAPPASSTGEIEAAFRDTDPEELQARYQAVAESIELVDGIDTCLTNTVGAGKAPNLELLKAELKEMQRTMAPYLPAGSAGLVADGEAAEGGPAGGPAPQRIAGEIHSREDVIKVLDKICQYYSRTEPASPVPNLLRRAQRLAGMDFMQIIQDMCPDAEGIVRGITGEKPPA